MIYVHLNHSVLNMSNIFSCKDWTETELGKSPEDPSQTLPLVLFYLTPTTVSLFGEHATFVVLNLGTNCNIIIVIQTE